MSFTLPDFNLVCSVSTGPWLSKVLRSSTVPCNLAAGRRVQQLQGVPDFPYPLGPSAPVLLVPPRTDIRDAGNLTGPDVIECPVGSGRWYEVSLVDDSGKGFANEYRRVAIFKICQAVQATLYAGLFWPTPIP